MRKKAIFLIFFGLSFVSSPKVFAQVSRLTQAIEKYAQGKLEEAIPDFEGALEEDKGNKKIEMYLLNCLVAVGTKYVKEQNYSKAYPYLERASKLAPEDKEVKEIYQILKTKIAPAVPKKAPPVPPVVVPQPPAIVPKPPAPVVKEVKPVKEKEVGIPKVEMVKPLPKKVVKEPLPEEVKPVPAVVLQPPEDFGKKVELVIARFEKQREELLAHLSEWEKMIKKEKEYLFTERKITMQRTVLIVGVILLSFTFFILFPVYRTARQSAEVRDKTLNEFKDKITKIVEKEKDALREFITQEANFFSQSLQGSVAKFKREFTEIEKKKEEAITAKEKIEKKEAEEPKSVQQPPAVQPEEEAIPQLADLFISEEEIIEGITPDLRLGAIEVIEKNLKSDDPVETLVAARLLESFLSDENEIVQVQAIKTLKKFVPEKVVESVKKMTLKKKRISSQVMRLIDDLPLKECQEVLFSLLEHPDPNIRKKAGNILVRLKEEGRKLSS